MSKQAYVEAVERMEYQNAKATSALLEEGIVQGLFPADARCVVFHRFEEHYMLQHLMGHSGWIARSYERMNSKGGKWVGPLGDLRRLNRPQRAFLLQAIHWANDLASPDGHRRAYALQQLQGQKGWRAQLANKVFQKN